MKLVSALVIATLASATTASASIAKLDKDGDLMITQKEFNNFYAGDKNTSVFRFVDSNNDNVIDLAEFEAQRVSSEGIFNEL